MNRTKLNPNYTFDNYIVGDFNELSYVVAKTIVGEPAIKYNPFFIYGKEGKTHLIQAIGNEIEKLHKNKKVVYITSEILMRDLIEGLKKHNTDKFYDKYLEYDVLIIDDLQFIGGKEKTEEEVVNFLDVILKNNKQIIVSLGSDTDRYVKLIDHARCNYANGIITDIGNPNKETLKAIIKAMSNTNKSLK